VKVWVLAALVLLIFATCATMGVTSASTGCYENGDGEGVYSISLPDTTYQYRMIYSGMRVALWNDGHPFYYRYYISVGNPDACIKAKTCAVYDDACTYYQAPGPSCTHKGSSSYSGGGYVSGDNSNYAAGFVVFVSPYWGDPPSSIGCSLVVSWTPFDVYMVSGTTSCVASTELYIYDSGNYDLIGTTADSTYSFEILDGYSYRMVFDGVYYDFTCTGSDVTFDYDACIWVYGYTCGVTNIKLYKDDGGWVQEQHITQAPGYDVYEMPIVSGGDYKISFIDDVLGGTTVHHNQTFTCTGDHVMIDYDRCEWIIPPSPWVPPTPIYIWTGYDYNIAVFKDEHGNLIENSKLAIYDKTDNNYIQKWADNSEGYALLGARFATDHDVLLSLRTFDGIFTLDTTYPANGSAEVGEENITTTNWTIPIKYNLQIKPVDQYFAPLFDVFCGLSEYTPLDPGAFWGMDLSDQGYVPVTNCSGFAMCDIMAEKEGYVDYKVEALNWTSKSAMVKDYRHNIVMEEE